MAKTSVVFKIQDNTQSGWPHNLENCRPFLARYHQDNTDSVCMVVGPCDETGKVVFFETDSSIYWGDFDYLVDEYKFVRYLNEKESIEIFGGS